MLYVVFAHITLWFCTHLYFVVLHMFDNVSVSMSTKAVPQTSSGIPATLTNGLPVHGYRGVTITMDTVSTEPVILQVQVTLADMVHISAFSKTEMTARIDKEEWTSHRRMVYGSSGEIVQDGYW